MLIVVPVSSADEILIDNFANIINAFGPYPEHELLIVSRPSDSVYAVKLFKKIFKSFQYCDIHVFRHDGLRGWPLGPNFYWSETIWHLHVEKQNTQPWLWMELDMTPLKPNWINLLQEEYKACGKPCLGILENTTTVTLDGVIVNLTKHLVGAALYPPNLTDFCSMWKNVSRINTAFDVLCQWEITPHSYASKIIQHGFRTKNYKIKENGIIQGEDQNNFPGGLRFDQPLDTNAVLHHGCDDGTLAAVLLSK
jgi:hypothetical protein